MGQFTILDLQWLLVSFFCEVRDCGKLRCSGYGGSGSRRRERGSSGGSGGGGVLAQALLEFLSHLQRNTKYKELHIFTLHTEMHSHALS